MMWALLAVCIIHGVSCQKPEIVDDIKPDIKPVNGIGYLNCTVVHLEEGETVHWAKVTSPDQNYSVDISENDKIVLQNSDKKGKLEDLGEPKYGVIVTEKTSRITFTLIIRYLQEEDAGQYRCYIKMQNVNHQEWPRKIGHMVVQVAPTIQNEGSSVYETVIGGNITLSCKAYGVPKPNITWKREDGGEIQTGGFQYRGSRLLLQHLEKRDQGNYICVADNSVRPPSSYSVQVKIFHAPSCRAVQKTVGQAQNRRFDAKLECIVEGHPEPSMNWEKMENTERLMINDDVNYETEKLSSSQSWVTHMWYTLLVKNVQANDYADYWCVATNTYGTCESKFNLFETMECQGANCPSLSIGGANQIAAYSLTLVSVVLSVPVIHWMVF